MTTELLPMPGMRSEVADSWRRSAAAGVAPDRVEAPVTVVESDLAALREAHPLSRVFPLLDDVLGQAVRECDAVMAIGDADGQLLWVCGSSAVLREAEKIGFVAGSNWDERLAGTNAPGLALATGQPSTITRAEHFRSSVRRWSCAAMPIHDPSTTQLLGVLDVTGGDQVAVPQTLAMLRTAARLAEAELARERVLPTLPERTGAGLRMHIEALGRSDALVTVDDGRGRPKTVRLSPRHSEILVLLASAPSGLTGDELSILLYDQDEPASSTLRAELNRLRGLLGDQLLASRPYRLTGSVTADWVAADAQLAAGDVRGAVRCYRGPVLPRSTAPGVERIRGDLAAGLRQALVRSGQPDLMAAWTRSAWGRDDYEMWDAQRRAIGTSSPLLPLIDGQLARLDAELA